MKSFLPITMLIATCLTAIYFGCMQLLRCTPQKNSTPPPPIETSEHWKSLPSSITMLNDSDVALVANGVSLQIFNAYTGKLVSTFHFPYNLDSLVWATAPKMYRGRTYNHRKDFNEYAPKDSIQLPCYGYNADEKVFMIPVLVTSEYNAPYVYQAKNVMATHESRETYFVKTDSSFRIKNITAVNDDSIFDKTEPLFWGKLAYVQDFIFFRNMGGGYDMIDLNAHPQVIEHVNKLRVDSTQFPTLNFASNRIGTYKNKSVTVQLNGNSYNFKVEEK